MTDCARILRLALSLVEQGTQVHAVYLGYDPYISTLSLPDGVRATTVTEWRPYSSPILANWEYRHHNAEVDGVRVGWTEDRATVAP